MEHPSRVPAVPPSSRTAQEIDPAPLDLARRRRWIGQVPRDVILIVLGVALAFVGEEWRDAHQRHARVDVAIASIHNELLLNRKRVAAARDHHQHVVDTLGKLIAAHALPDSGVYLHGIWNPAIVTSTAWEAARGTGVLDDIPLETVLSIAPAYERQERYRALTEALGAEVMSDLRRDGIDAVLRDRFAQFVPLDVDFASRERDLLEAYDSALAKIVKHH